MPQVLSDIVDVYVFRRLNARVQFLLLQRRPDVALPHTWQAFHSQVRVGDTTLQTIIGAVKQLAGLNVSAIYSADYVNQFYDEGRDAIVLAPVFAVHVNPQSPINLGDDYRDAAWFDRDEATARLPFSGQRWAVRHIDEIMSLGEAETAIYEIDMTTHQPPQQRPDETEEIDDDDQWSDQTKEPGRAAADEGRQREQDAVHADDTLHGDTDAQDERNSDIVGAPPRADT